nr:hypothetical protein OG781_17765 [Streptomyces sp. NBC_00830]
MSANEKAPALVEQSEGRKNLLGGGSEATVAQADPPRVPGRLDTYRSRSAKWHRQVKVDKCPGCGHPHLHRAPLPLVRSVLKTAPCGTVYVVVLRVPAVAA